MAGYYDDPAQRLDDLLDAQETRIATIFRTAIEALKGEIDLTELANLIQQGRLNEALEKLQFAAEALANASNVAFVTTGQSTAQLLATAGVGRVVFDQVNTNAVAAMQANQLLLIREFTNEQRKATSMALVSGVETAINPIAQARNFRDSIGLTEKQWADVARYRAVLEAVGTSDQTAQTALTRALSDGRSDKSVLAAARKNKPLPSATIDLAVERYAARKIKHRAEVIGRTEALRAVHQGNEEMYRQAIAAGTVNAEDLVRTWVTRTDGRERSTHLLLNGVKKGWGDTWETKNGPLRYPGDPDAPAAETVQCRCAIATRIRQRAN